MCGRFTLTTPAELVAEAFGLDAIPDLEARYNVAPSQPVAVVRAGASGRRELSLVSWGLPGPGRGRLINARAETAHSRHAFGEALRHRRCLIPADGFYEWVVEAEGPRRPYHFRLCDGRPFAFAGFWSPVGSEEACAILTTTPNACVRPIHDRMPVMLAPEDYAAWLDPARSEPAELGPLFRPYAATAMEAVRVSLAANNPRNDSPACLAVEVPPEASAEQPG
jgi:putative SOS response-associated peptidase YedK